MKKGLYSTWRQEAAEKFLGAELGAGGYTSFIGPERINTSWASCPS